MPKKLSKGFTLIELLIVIAIIGVLSGIVAISMAYAPKQARDATRKSNLELIRSGLEIYNADCGSYSTSNFLSSSLVGTTGSCNGNIYITSVSMPKDPKSGQNYYYASASPGSTYILCARLEIAPSPVMDVTGCGANCGGTCNYKVTNP